MSGFTFLDILTTNVTPVHFLKSFSSVTGRLITALSSLRCPSPHFLTRWTLQFRRNTSV